MAMHGKRKKFSVQPAGGMNADINVTPMVDVVLVLLIIFMVVTPLLEKDIEVKVPQTEEVEQMDEVPPDQVVVDLKPNGQITINNDPVNSGDYVERMKRIMAAKAKGDKLVFFMAEDLINYGQLVALLDQTKQAGAETLGMMTEPPEDLPATAPGEPGVPPAPPAP